MSLRIDRCYYGKIYLQLVIGIESIITSVDYTALSTITYTIEY